MTRRDLEEVVMNLEYLVVHHFDASKTEEYERLLQTFRVDLQRLNQPRQAPTPRGTDHSPRWHRLVARQKR